MQLPVKNFLFFMNSQMPIQMSSLSKYFKTHITKKCIDSVSLNLFKALSQENALKHLLQGKHVNIKIWDFICISSQVNENKSGGRVTKEYLTCVHAMVDNRILIY